MFWTKTEDLSILVLAAFLQDTWNLSFSLCLNQWGLGGGGEYEHSYTYTNGSPGIRIVCVCVLYSWECITAKTAVAVAFWFEQAIYETDGSNANSQQIIINKERMERASEWKKVTKKKKIQEENRFQRLCWKSRVEVWAEKRWREWEMNQKR